MLGAGKGGYGTGEEWGHMERCDILGIASLVVGLPCHVD